MNARSEDFQPPIDWESTLSACEAHGQPSPEERAAWLSGLREHLNADPELCTPRGRAEHRARLLAVATTCDDLPLVRYLCELRARLAEAGPEDAISHAIALWRLGHLHAAIDVSRRQLLTHPDDGRCAELHQQLLASLRTPRPFPFPDDGVGDEQLRLIPLGDQHLHDFVWQYHDPAIAELCCLPGFASDAEWHAWLARGESYGDQMTCAVIHADWGFVGSVSLVLRDGLGFFYYWLGSDFRGLGIGPRACALLLNLARDDWGMHGCYAKVFTRNTASQRGLEKMGFQATALPIRCEPEAELLYRWGDEGTNPDQAAAEARTLFAAMGSRIRVLRPMLGAADGFLPTPVTVKESRHVR